MKAEEEVRQEGSMVQNLISGRLCVGLSECDPTENTKNIVKKWKAPFMITEVHQAEYFHSFSTPRAAHYENIKLPNPSTKDWCISEDMEKSDFLMVNSACEIGEKCSREDNDGNEVLEEGTKLPLEPDAN